MFNVNILFLENEATSKETPRLIEVTSAVKLSANEALTNLKRAIVEWMTVTEDGKNSWTFSVFKDFSIQNILKSFSPADGRPLLSISSLQPFLKKYWILTVREIPIVPLSRSINTPLITEADLPNQIKTIRMIVSAENANGEPDFFICKIDTTQCKIDSGEHYAFAQQIALARGFSPKLAYDEDDDAGRMLLYHFSWEDASTYTQVS